MINGDWRVTLNNVHIPFQAKLKNLNLYFYLLIFLHFCGLANPQGSVTFTYERNERRKLQIHFHDLPEMPHFINVSPQKSLKKWTHPPVDETDPSWIKWNIFTPEFFFVEDSDVKIWIFLKFDFFWGYIFSIYPCLIQQESGLFWLFGGWFLAADVAVDAEADAAADTMIGGRLILEKALMKKYKKL